MGETGMLNKTHTSFAEMSLAFKKSPFGWSRQTAMLVCYSAFARTLVVSNVLRFVPRSPRLFIAVRSTYSIVVVNGSCLALQSFCLNVSSRHIFLLLKCPWHSRESLFCWSRPKAMLVYYSAFAVRLWCRTSYASCHDRHA